MKKYFLLALFVMIMLSGCSKEEPKVASDSGTKQTKAPQEVTFLCPSNAGGAMVFEHPFIGSLL